MINQLKKYRINKVDILNYILVIALIYLMCTRKYNKYDEIITLILGINCLYKIFYLKNYTKINKIIILLVGWSILMTNSLINMMSIYSKGHYLELYKYIIVDGVLIFFIFSQLNINFLLIDDRLLKLINFLSIYPILKGINFILEKGTFIRGYIWGNPNFYSMILGIFIIISFIGYITEKNIK